MQADTTSRSAPATRSHGCRQSPSLTFRCLPTTLLRNRNTSAPGGCGRARQADAVMAPDPIMAAQRPSFPACPWSLLSDITENGRDAPLVRTSTRRRRFRPNGHASRLACHVGSARSLAVAWSRPSRACEHLRRAEPSHSATAADAASQAAIPTGIHHQSTSTSLYPDVAFRTPPAPLPIAPLVMPSRPARKDPARGLPGPHAGLADLHRGRPRIPVTRPGRPAGTPSGRPVTPIVRSAGLPICLSGRSRRPARTGRLSRSAARGIR
jgi:hypothetical protein